MPLLPPRSAHDRCWLAAGIGQDVVERAGERRLCPSSMHRPRIGEVSPARDVLTGEGSSVMDIVSLGTRAVL